MSSFTLLQGISGVQRALFSAPDGSPLEALGAATDDGARAASARTASAGAAAARQLGSLGQALGLGVCQLVIARTNTLAIALIPREGAVAILEVDPKQLSRDVEKTLRSRRWSARDLDLVLRPAPARPAAAPPESRSNTAAAERTMERLLRPASAAPVLEAPSGPVPVDVPPDHAVRKRVMAGAAAGAHTIFSGSLRVVGVPDLLEFCRNGRRTGVLVCGRGETNGSVTVHNGRIIDAEAPAGGSPSILERLRATGVISDAQIESLSLSSGDAADAEIVGKRLIGAGFATAEAIQAAVADRVQSSIEFMLDWEDGSFAFHPSRDMPAPSVVVGIDPQHLLLRLFKERDERGRDAGVG
jgi:hypothetical protein